MFSPVQNMFYSTLPLDIAANSNTFKAIACLPAVGSLCSLIQQQSLKTHIANTTNPLYRIELIELKNQYKTADIIRECLHITLTITMVALSSLNRLNAFGLCLFTTQLALALYTKRHNEHVIENLLKNSKTKPHIL